MQYLPLMIIDIIREEKKGFENFKKSEKLKKI